MLELLYLTRCPDGTFALCMDSSPPKPPTPPPPPPPPPQPDEQTVIVSLPVNNKKPAKPKVPRKKKPKQKKEEEDNDIVLLSEKRDIDPQPSSSSSTITKRPILKEKQTNTYVLMKHRRCYSTKIPQCLHSLTLEYNICREHTIRHMCHTQEISKRRKFKPKSNIIRLVDEAADCLKTIVNDVVKMEENRLDIIRDKPSFTSSRSICLDESFPSLKDSSQREVLAE
jgi:outer membrane biosynthesis protein TonB